VSRLRRRPAAGDDGVSLPELIVTMALLGLFTTLVMLLVTSVSRSFTTERSATSSTMAASTGMNELTRVVRSGTVLQIVTGGADEPVFLDARANSMILYAYIDTSGAAPRPVKIQFSIDAQQRLRESRWNATASKAPWTFDSTPRPARTIATSVVTTATQPLFTYYNKDGNALPVPAGGTLSAADRKLVAAVQIHLTVQSDTTGRAEPVEISNTVSIPNLGVTRVRP
jgi:prepilin-type N-terminal cleavage/methylation domain-containing protein